MHWTTLALTFAVSVSPTANASTKYGCWSESGAVFHESCTVALTALIASRSYVDHDDWVSVSKTKRTYIYGNCRAELFATAGYTVAARSLISSFDQLASRCQNGWFYYDNGWLGAAIGGRAGWKRDEQDNTTVSHPESISEFAQNSILQWEENDSPEQLLEPEGFVFPHDSTDTSETGNNNERQHARDLTTRADPVGALLKTEAFEKVAFKLYRGTGHRMPGQRAVTYTFTRGFLSTIGAVMNSAKSNMGTGILRNGIALPSTSSVTTLAVAAQLNSGAFANWDAFAKYLKGESLSMMGVMMAHALDDIVKYGWAGAVYHVYNPYNVVIFSFILNGVAGQTTPFPPN